MSANLSLGPVLYHWSGEAWRDFHFRIADEAPVDTVYLGEVVCPKRTPFMLPHLDAVAERLRRAGKEVVWSTPALVAGEADMVALRAAVERAGAGALVEVNDVAAFSLVAGRPHAIGPYVNVYNEPTLATLARQGAVRVTPPVELSRQALAALAGAHLAELEVMAFGRLPLALSARCYAARVYGLAKDGCQYVCGADPDGLPVATLDEEPFLAVNGIQTMSYAYGCLLGELDDLIALGVRRFRLSPQRVDMVMVASLYRAVLDRRRSAAEAREALAGIMGEVPLSNGFYHRAKGIALVGSGNVPAST